jgi:hypothetical protein
MHFNDYSNPEYKIRWVNWNDYVKKPENQDYSTLLNYADEFYRMHCPAITYYELDKRATSLNSAGVIPGESAPSTASKLSTLWGEQVGPMQFSRKMDVHAFPSYSEGRKHMHTARGLEIEQLIRFSFGLVELQRKDIFPNIGDQVDYLGLRYTILDVYTKPEDIFMQVGLPMHITIDSAIFRFGDAKKEYVRKDLTLK